MTSQELKQRFKEEPDKRKMGGKIRNKKMAMAKRGLRSLTIAVAVPLSLSLLNAYLGSGKTHLGAVLQTRCLFRRQIL
ncbi:hypothetical protein K1719_031938 [Acacia pycnantha]|nr:hypothetical protein K1719_031938 [Acacia pycnantha]